MATDYLVQMRVTLEPVGKPWVIVQVNGQGQLQQLFATTNFSFDIRATDTACLEITHFDKPNNDIDTAVIVQSISFFGIEDPRFVWAGTYYPNYPDHYHDKIPALTGQGYLGWNGVYRLDFSVPVFSWMHQIQSLGWIYQ